MFDRRCRFVPCGGDRHPFWVTMTKGKSAFHCVPKTAQLREYAPDDANSRGARHLEYGRRRNVRCRSGAALPFVSGKDISLFSIAASRTHESTVLKARDRHAIVPSDLFQTHLCAAHQAPHILVSRNAGECSRHSRPPESGDCEPVRQRSSAQFVTISRPRNHRKAPRTVRATLKWQEIPTGSNLPFEFNPDGEGRGSPKADRNCAFRRSSP